MKVAELRALSLEDLQAKLAEKTQEHVENRRSLAAGELANPRVIRNGRREIAVLKTVIAEQLRDSNNKKEKENA